jgi:hypothetical protein
MKSMKDVQIVGAKKAWYQLDDCSDAEPEHEVGRQR